MAAGLPAVDNIDMTWATAIQLGDTNCIFGVAAPTITRPISGVSYSLECETPPDMAPGIAFPLVNESRKSVPEQSWS